MDFTVLPTPFPLPRVSDLRFGVPVRVLLSASAPQVPPVLSAEPAPTASPPAETALVAGVRPGPSLLQLPGWRPGAAAALSAFRISCPSLVKRTDRSGLTWGEDWRAACDAAAGASDPAAFFEQYFETAVVASGEAFLTGYYAT